MLDFFSSTKITGLKIYSTEGLLWGVCFGSRAFAWRGNRNYFLFTNFLCNGKHVCFVDGFILRLELMGVDGFECSHENSNISIFGIFSFYKFGDVDLGQQKSSIVIQWRVGILTFTEN